MFLLVIDLFVVGVVVMGVVDWVGVGIFWFMKYNSSVIKLSNNSSGINYLCGGKGDGFVVVLERFWLFGVLLFGEKGVVLKILEVVLFRLRMLVSLVGVFCMKFKGLLSRFFRFEVLLLLMCCLISLSISGKIRFISDFEVVGLMLVCDVI